MLSAVNSIDSQIISGDAKKVLVKFSERMISIFSRTSGGCEVFPQSFLVDEAGKLKYLIMFYR